MNNKKTILNIMYVCIIIISCLLISFSYHLKIYYSSSYFEQLLYNLLNTTTLKLTSLEKAYVEIPSLAIIISCLLLIPLFFRFNFKINILKKDIKIFPINIKKYSIIVFIISVMITCYQIRFHTYLWNQINDTRLYDKYYVKYNKKNVNFTTKRNLIHIYVESLENSNFSTSNGGLQKESYMPNLEKLALDNINFSNNNKLGGFKSVNGTNWTIAGMVAQTSGVPIYIKTKNKNNIFLEGATSLGDILYDNGYSNYLMIGSDAKFGERDDYFKRHGNYKIMDYNYAIDNGMILKNYYKWWGFEDSLLFSFARNELVNISKDDKPFNFTILTADTHFYDGYVDSSCKSVFDSHYANSFNCEDNMLYSFISWVKEQDFYKNTTIVVTGDHLTMQDGFYKSSNNYTRTVFNMFINPINKPANDKNREFTSFDIFPTTLSSIGATIKDDRLSLGTNLFSDKKTLCEEIGYKKFSQEISKRSNYYNKYILK